MEEAFMWLTSRQSCSFALSVCLAFYNAIYCWWPTYHLLPASAPVSASQSPGSVWVCCPSNLRGIQQPFLFSDASFHTYGSTQVFTVHTVICEHLLGWPQLTVGMACSCKEGFIVGGILLGYLASALWVGETGGWRYMYGAALPPALIVFAGMVSPHLLSLPHSAL